MSLAASLGLAVWSVFAALHEPTSPRPRELSRAFGDAREPVEAAAPLGRRVRAARGWRDEPTLDFTMLHAGARRMDSNTLDELFGWTPYVGIEYSARDLQSGLGFEAGAYLAGDDGRGVVAGSRTSADAWFYEVMTGGRYTWRLPGTRLYLLGGTGLDVIYTDGDVGGSDIDELSWGGYVHGGAYLEFSSWLLGVDARQTVFTDLSDSAVDTTGTYFQLGVVLSAGL